MAGKSTGTCSAVNSAKNWHKDTHASARWSRQAAQVTHRDAKDSTVVNFTTAADGVVTLDSSDLDFDGTVQAAPDIVDTVVNHSPVPLRAVHGD